MNYMAFFCDGIRDEVYGTKTITGMMDPGLKIPGPGLIPKLACGVFIQMDNTDICPPKVVTLRITSFGEVYERDYEKVADENFVSDHQRGSIFHELIPFVVTEEGAITVELKSDIDDKYRLAGILNVTFDKEATFPGFRAFAEDIDENENASTKIKPKRKTVVKKKRIV